MDSYLGLILGGGSLGERHPAVASCSIDDGIRY